VVIDTTEKGENVKEIILPCGYIGFNIAPAGTTTYVNSLPTFISQEGKKL
jgi:hypothetical protein